MKGKISLKKKGKCLIVGPSFEGFEEWLARVIRTPPQEFPGILQCMPANDQQPQGWLRLIGALQSKGMNGLKEAGVVYGIHSPCEGQVLCNLATQNRVILQDWKDLLAAILEASPQLQCLSWWREEAADTEQGSQTRGVKRVKDQLPGEGQYANLQRQTQLDATVVPCSLVALRAQNMVEESRKRSKTRDSDE